MGKLHDTDEAQSMRIERAALTPRYSQRVELEDERVVRPLPGYAARRGQYTWLEIKFRKLASSLHVAGQT